jgi:signal transduction histidine kinase
MPPGIHVAKDYDPSVPPIPAYAGELNQVWTNLIDNAVSAMGDTGVLTVRTGMDRDKVFIEFGDTGPGVPPEIKNRIFEPFFTTKPVGEGTGLGLDISFRIVVNKHHGELSLESEPGDTRFRVWLPLTPQDDGAALTPDGLDAVTAAARTSAGTAASQAAETAGVAASAKDKENS